MKTLYVECNMGISGDMLLGALTELLASKEDFLTKLENIGVQGVKVHCKKVSKCDIMANKLDFEIGGEIEGEHVHRHGEKEVCEESNLAKIESLIDSLAVSERVKAQAIEIYQSIAEAEGKVHGKSVQNIHFHELGAMDAILDIIGTALALEEINADKIIFSPINLGGGSVNCGHGKIPVPAPATAELIKGLEVFSSGNVGELTTPTGAALARYYAEEFSSMPPMTIQKTGIGGGSKDFEQANILRVFLGEMANAEECILEISANIDDMTGEELSFAFDKLFDAGALEVFSTSVHMKKNRMGFLLTALTKKSDENKIVTCFFKHTTTIGVRKVEVSREKLSRESAYSDSIFGKVAEKKSSGYGENRSKIEFEELKKIAEEKDISIFKAREFAKLNKN